MPDHYGTVAGADQYHSDRGNAAWTGDDSAKEAALVRASAYIDGKYQFTNACGRWESMFSGSKAAGRAQSLQWPRKNAFDSEGEPIPDTEVPVEIEQATYEAAIRELAAPGSLSPDYVASSAVKRQKIDVLEIEYQAPAENAGGVPTRPVVTVVDELVAPLLRNTRLCGIGVFVV